MKSILLFALTLCVIALARAEDDGKYRAGRYVSDGRYFNNYYNGRYDNGYRHFYGNNYYPNNNYYHGNNYPGWTQPYPYNARPYTDLLAPFASSGKDNSAADSAVIKPKPIEAKPAVTIVAPTTAAPKIHLPTTVVPTTALPRVAYAKFGNEGQARIVSQDSDTEANGYNYSFRTENGINVGETGLVDAANSHGGTRVKGFYEYVGDDGLVYRVDYTADENGFHATGAHLP